jgi:hypothetical protein
MRDDELFHSVRRVAEAITPTATAGKDAVGGTVISLTEAVMGITAALVQIAEATYDLADAVRSHGEPE